MLRRARDSTFHQSPRDASRKALVTPLATADRTTPLAVRLPNFFIGGAPNTGTTSLYHYLRQHPQVFLSPVKEPTYFGAAEAFVERYGGDTAAYVARNRTLARRLHWFIKGAAPALTWEDYLTLFRGVRDETAIGEASVRYLILPAAARMIRLRIPNARIIFVLRDPAEWLLTRYFSSYWPDRRSSFQRRFAAAIKQGGEWRQAVRTMRYGTHLKRFFDEFPRDQLQVHLYEDLRQDSHAVLKSILTFLRIDPQYPINLAQQHNRTVVPRSRAFDTLRQRLLRRTPLLQLLPAGVRARLRKLYYRRRPDLVMDPADRAQVIDYYRDEILHTADLIGRDLSAWLR